MKVVPHIIQPGQKMYRHGTKTKSARAFGPGEVVYLITIDHDLYFGQAFSDEKLTRVIRSMLGRHYKLNLKSFKPELPKRVM